MSVLGSSPAPGWYPAPDGRPASRFWDGKGWTLWLTDGRRTWTDVPVRRPLTGDDLAALRFVEEVFLPEAFARGAIAPQQRAGLGGLVQGMAVEAAATPGAAARAAARAASAEQVPVEGSPAGSTPTPSADGAPPADALFASPTGQVADTAAPQGGPPAPPPAGSPVPPQTAWLPGARPAAPPGTYPAAAMPNPHEGTAYPPTAYPRTAYPPTAYPPTARQSFAGRRPAQPPHQPGPLARWWSATWAEIGSDVTVHGLAYLGVLLLFVGVFGLVAFAFGSVAPSVRPIAELASATVTFAAARMLLRHGATVVARAMEGVGGLILPLMIVTSTVDDFAFPPDLHGNAMPVVLAAVCVALAAGYVAWIARHRSSGLRFVVAPTVWLGVAMGAIGLGRPIPTGQDVAVAGSGQVAAIAVALALTALVARVVARRGTATTDTATTDTATTDTATTDTATTDTAERVEGLLVPAAQSAALVGSVVVAALGLVTWIAEGWPTAPVVVTAVALAATVQLLPRVPAAVADVGAVLWWVLVAIRLLADAGPDWVGLVASVAALGFAALLEVIGRRARSVTALGLAVGGLVLAVLAATPATWWVAGLCAVLTVWAAARRRVPFPAPGAPAILDGLAAALPVIGVLAVGVSEGVDVGLLVAAGVVLVATIPARLARMGRGAADRFWQLWWWSAGATTVVAVALRGLATLAAGGAGPEVWFGAGSDGFLAWSVTIAAVALAVGAAFGPLPGAVRAWVVVGLGWWAWVTGVALVDATPMLRTAVPAVVALALVGLVHARRTPEGVVPERAAPEPLPTSFAALGLSGHLLGVVTLAIAGGGWPAEVALVAASLGWAITALAADRRRSPVADVLDRIGAVGRLAPWSLALAGVPLAATGALHLAGVVDLGAPWGSAALMATAVVFAAVLRVFRDVRRSPAAGPLMWLAFACAASAVLLPGGSWPFTVAGAALVVAVVVLPAGCRAAVMVWSAWLVVVPVLAAVAWNLGSSSDGESRDLLTLWTLVAGSGLLALAALLADGGRFGAPRVLPHRHVLRPPAVLGAAQLLLWLVVALAAHTEREAAVVLGAAGLILAIAAVSGVGITAGLGLVVAWVGWHQGADPGTPWADVAVAMALVAAGVGVSLMTGRRRGWSRWDVPVALAAVPAALTSLATAHGGDVAPVFTVVGLLVVGAAVRLGRRRVLSEVLGVVGTGIILIGTAQASAGWLALALVALSAAHTVLAAIREVGTARTIRQVVGAVAGASAWGATLSWLDWSDRLASEVTSAGGALVVVLLLLAGSGGRLGRSWVAVWGATGTLLALGALLGAVDGGRGEAHWSWWHVVALLLLALAAGLVVRLWSWAPGRTVAVGFGLASLLVAFAVLDLSTATRVGVLVGVSAACAVGTVLLAWLGQGQGTDGDADADRGAVGAPAVQHPARHDWLLPVTGGGLAAVVLALGLAAASGSVLLAAPLAGATVQVAAAGVAWRKIGLRLAAPMLAWLTWAALVPEIAGGASASWYTLPVGLALLAVVGMWRAERRSQGLAPSDSPGVALELTGIAFLVVTSWVQAFTVSVLHALLATAIGIAVLAWGMTSRVRRRFAAGAVVIVVSLVLAVMAPLVALVPAWGGAAVWIAVAVLGMVAVLVATLLEKGRLAAERAGERGWE